MSRTMEASRPFITESRGKIEARVQGPIANSTSASAVLPVSDDDDLFSTSSLIIVTTDVTMTVVETPDFGMLQPKPTTNTILDKPKAAESNALGEVTQKHTEPAHIEPTHTQPAQTQPAQTRPAQTQQTQPAKTQQQQPAKKPAAESHATVQTPAFISTTTPVAVAAAASTTPSADAQPQFAKLDSHTSTTEAPTTTIAKAPPAETGGTEVVSIPSDVPTDSLVTAPARTSSFSPASSADGSATGSLSAAPSWVDGSGSSPPMGTSILADGHSTTVPLSPDAGATHKSDSGHNSSGMNKPQTPVIIGSIVGVAAGLMALAILVWFLRRRMQKRRRSTLLTPLSLPPGGVVGGSTSGKDTPPPRYEIDNDSLGPTRRSTRWVAAVSTNAEKLGKRLQMGNTGSMIAPNQENSQAFMALPTHSRNASLTTDADAAATTRPDRPMSTVNRILSAWFSADQHRMSQDMTEVARGDDTDALGSYIKKNLDVEAQRRPSQGPNRDTQWPAPAGSQAANPFADQHDEHDLEGGHSNVEPNFSNPFADSEEMRQTPNAWPMPPTQSPMTPPPPLLRKDRTPSIVYRDRDANASSSTLSGTRKKTRSDPFDLEMEDELPDEMPSDAAHLGDRPEFRRDTRYTAASSFYGSNKAPSARHHRDSYTSRYDSGTSDSWDWQKHNVPDVPDVPGVPPGAAR